MNGILNVNKPQGLTSHDVVARVRRITHQKKAGHAGTLDPLATGVLPVVLGSATRLVEYLADEDKAYRATITLGATTDTYDREGAITPTPGALMPGREDLEHALADFRGEISQLPPMYSAIKVGGKKLYEMARAGTHVDLQPRQVTIRTLNLESYRPPQVQLSVECSKGTYIRSLAHDLGATLGTGAYLDTLVRTRHGPFSIETAVTLKELEEAFKEGTGERFLLPPESILRGWTFWEASPEVEIAIRQGKSLELPAPGQGERSMIAARTGAGDLLAVLYWQADKGLWHPEKVFA